MKIRSNEQLIDKLSQDEKIKYVFLSTFFTADYDVLFRVFLFVRIMDCEFLTRTR